MKKAITLLALALSVGSCLSAQTVTFNDSTVVNASPARQGLNIGSIDYFDNGQHLKNLFGYNNPSLEPILDQQSILVTAAGTTTTFTDPNQFDPVASNYWTGATYTVIQSASGGAEAGCTGTITSNTGPNFPGGGSTAPVYTMGTACAHAIQNGDLIFVSLAPASTPEAWWESGAGGVGNSSVSGGGQLLSDTTDLCATCGSQALEMNMPSASATAHFEQLWDTEGTDIFYLMNGTYSLTFWAKIASGAPTLAVNCSRGSAGGFSTSTFTPSLTSTWTLYTFTFTAAETQSTTSIGNAACFFNGSATSAGALYFDNPSLVKTGTSGSNPTVFRDEDFALLQKFFGNGASTSGPPGTLRYWVNQNGETAANLTALPYQRRPSSSGIFYQINPAGGASMTLSLEDYLILCQALGVQPYFEIPVTISTTDAANLVEFLAATTATTYGARRQAAGIAAGLSSGVAATPWTSVFTKIYLSYCNECWNQSAGASLQNIPQRSGEPGGEVYFDYSTRAAAVLAAMRADSAYSGSVMQLGINAQTGINFSMDAGIARSKPDYIEIENYLYGNVGSFSTDTLLWQANYVEPYDMMVDPSDPSNFYQSVHDYDAQTTCGAAGTTTCYVNIYEWGQGTQNGSIDQTHMDFINAGGGQAAISAFQPLLQQQLYPTQIPQHNFFAFSEFENGSAISGVTSKLWGNMIDAGGATNNVRPEFLGLALANQSIIGPMYSCPVTGSGSTFNFAGNSSNGTNVPPGVPAVSNVPVVYAFCFKNGASRSVVLVNTDLSSSHTVTFAGTPLPTGTVTVRQVAPPTLDSLNEAATGTPTNHTAATVVATTTTVSSPSSIALPAFSATALDFSTGSAPAPPAQLSGKVAIRGKTSVQ
jgi:hypothetical protein